MCRILRQQWENTERILIFPPPPSQPWRGLSISRDQWAVKIFRNLCQMPKSWLREVFLCFSFLFFFFVFVRHFPTTLGQSQRAEKKHIVAEINFWPEIQVKYHIPGLVVPWVLLESSIYGIYYFGHGYSFYSHFFFLPTSA